MGLVQCISNGCPHTNNEVGNVMAITTLCTLRGAVNKRYRRLRRQSKMDNPQSQIKLGNIHTRYKKIQNRKLNR